MKDIGKVTSTQIKYCRLISIYFMTIVHIPPGLGDKTLPEFLIVPKILIIDILGRASLPSLSWISGFLMYFSLKDTPVCDLIRKRFKALIVPMMFWNAALMVLGLLVLIAVGEKMTVIELLKGLGWSEIIFDRLLALNYGAASDSLNFLRDLFVCVVLSWPIMKAIEKASWLVPLAVFVVDVSLGFQPVVMRGSILVYYTLGLAVAHHLGSFDFISRLRLLALAGLAVVLTREFPALFGAFDLPDSVYELIKRASVSILFLDTSLYLARTVESPVIHRLDPPNYLFFLSHNVGYAVLWAFWVLMFGKDLTPVYSVYFLFAPVVLFASVIATHTFLKRLPGTIQILVAGRRIPPARALP